MLEPIEGVYLWRQGKSIGAEHMEEVYTPVGVDVNLAKKLLDSINFFPMRSPWPYFQFAWPRGKTITSFRGEETRNSFTSHLHAALCQKKIETFIDNRLVRGDEISQALVDAIQDSKISILVFSKGYASSRWCLDELVKILECKQKYDQIVIPVFYEIDPSNVRNQTGTFADAFKEHGKYKERLPKLQTWRTALKEASNLSGFNSAVIRPESILVKEIVKDVLKKLNISQSSYMDLIGIDSRIMEIEWLLCAGSIDIPVCSVGIWGIGGIGKTSLADAVFSKISSQFEVSYFIQNIREVSEESGGLIRMQKELLSVILEDEDLNIGSHRARTTFTRKRLRCKKVLIVFDDVTNYFQVESLVGGLDFGSGSRFILTTRDKQVLRNCSVDRFYEVKGLSRDEALELFCQYAFRENKPSVDYMKMSREVVTYASGVPLALKVLGSFLLGRKKKDWESAVEKIKKFPHEGIQKVLKISYDGLDAEVKDLFLDIACFFKWNHKDHVTNILNACGFCTEIGLDVLIDKSLIMMEGSLITMHDLIQEMGREIVRQESKVLGERSRLWQPNDIYHVLTTNTGTKAIEAISLDMSEIREIQLHPHAFAKMYNLRLLNFYNPCDKVNENKLQVLQDLEFGSTKFGYFHWIGCPLKSLGSNFNLDYLARLELPHSSIEQLWNGVQHLDKLKHIDLSHSKNIRRFPDISLVINLETLILKGCTSLVEFASTIPLKPIRTLDLSGCSNLKIVPEMSFIMENLSLDETAVEECSPFISSSNEVKDLEPVNYFEARGIVTVRVPSSTIRGMCSLTNLNLADCGIRELPNSLGWLYSLERLYLSRNNFESIPETIIDLSKLDRFELNHCKRLQSLPVLPRNIRILEAQCCTSLEVLSGLPFLFTTISTSGLCWILNFLHCQRLERAFRDIVKHVVLNIQLMGAAWFEEFHNKFIPRARLFVPGKEIPEWFHFQSTRNSIIFEVPPNGNRNFVCVVCIAMVFHVGGLRGSYVCKINGKTVHFMKFDQRSEHNMMYDFFLLGYKDCGDQFDGRNSSNEVSFHLTDGLTKVKKFGVHFVYDEDFEQQPIKEITTSSFNSDFRNMYSFSDEEDTIYPPFKSNIKWIKYGRRIKRCWKIKRRIRIVRISQRWLVSRN